jgi:hypothetical protein
VGGDWALEIESLWHRAEIESYLVPVKWQVLNAFKEKGKDSDPE